MSTVLLLGCAQAPPVEVAQDVVVNTDSVEFMIFQQNEQVMALYRGPSVQLAENRLKLAAVRAIERAAGCPVRGNSLEISGLKVYGQINCARANSLFLRARRTDRGRSARAGGYLRPPKFPETEPNSVASG